MPVSKAKPLTKQAEAIYRAELGKENVTFGNRVMAEAFATIDALRKERDALKRVVRAAIWWHTTPYGRQSDIREAVKAYLAKTKESNDEMSAPG